MKTDRNPAGAAPIGVLICDDNPEIRTILTEIIGLEPGLRVLGHACDGNDVIAKAKLLKPDVIILDLAMPNKSGLDALLELALAAPSAKTIVLSVYVAPSVVQEAMQRGAVGYVEKGNGMIDELLGAIVTAVETAPAAPAEQNGGGAGPADPALEERGPSAAASMQAASRRDSRADDRDQAAELRDRSAEHRDALARRDSQRANDRNRTASDQAQRLLILDQKASRRDQQIADDDQQAADADFAAGGDAALHDRGVRARNQSEHDRGVVSALRGEAAAARRHENEDDASLEDGLRLAERRRVEAADDRREGARDRADALRNRAESAHAERRAVETLESMSDAFFTLDSQWRFTYLNPQTEVILERHREDLLGKILWDEFPGSVGSQFDEGYRQAVREQVPVRFEAAKEPGGRILEVRAFPVRDGLAVYFTDVTTERLQQDRSLQAQRLEAIGRATAGVAHDFGNILAAVRAFAQLGQRSSVDEKATRYFGEIDAAGQKAAQLTHQLTAFARRQDLTPAVIDLNDVVAGLSSILHQLLPAGMKLSCALSPQPVPVFVDRSQLEQVLVNLVINSGDAIDAVGTITLSTTTDDPVRVAHDIRPTPSGWLQVADTGSGIPTDVLPHIFDPFFSTKPPGTGSGLGLATAHGIICQSGGDILVESSPGVGTTMTVVLPADRFEPPPS